jgi:acyl carrier protein
MSSQQIAVQIEQFVRTRFRVAKSDTRFSRAQPLFEMGYVDSIGFVELLAFLSEQFHVEVPDEMLMSEDFSTIDDIALVVDRLSNGRSEVRNGSTG